MQSPLKRKVREMVTEREKDSHGHRDVITIHNDDNQSVSTVRTVRTNTVKIL